MANEVRINIESSLAAMAFVLAEQQQNIKELKKDSDDWKQRFIEANNGLSEQSKDNIVLRDNIQHMEKELKDLKKDFQAISDANMELCEHNTELKDKVLQWHEIGDHDTPLQGYELPFTIEDYPRTPYILLKVEILKDNWFDNLNNPIPINTQSIMYIYPCIENGRYTLSHNDTCTKAIAWCVVSDKNF